MADTKSINQTIGDNMISCKLSRELDFSNTESLIRDLEFLGLTKHLVEDFLESVPVCKSVICFPVITQDTYTYFGGCGIYSLSYSSMTSKSFRRSTSSGLKMRVL